MADLNSNEQWRAIKWFPVYEVSDRGRVRSHKKCRALVLRPATNHDGYLYVSLSLGGKHQCKLVHALVLEAFRCPRPDNLVCDHIDNDKSNNHIENLRWITRAENCRRGYRIQLDIEKVMAIRESSERIMVLAERYGVNRSTVYDVRNYHSWRPS